MAAESSGSRWWLWVLALVGFLLLVLFGGLAIGLGVFLVGKGTSSQSKPESEGGGADVELRVVGLRVTRLGSNEEITDPCAIEATGVIIYPELGASKVVSDLIKCLKGRGITVWIDGVKQ